MYSLIVALIAISLCAALTLGAYFVLGHLPHDASVSAQVSALANQSSQITAASVFYTVVNVGQPPATLEALQSSQFLSVIPSLWLDPPPGESLVSRPVTGPASSNVCEAFNWRYGIQGIPLCTNTGGIATPVCCQ